MARFLVVTPDAGGNLPPTLAIARALADRGHAVSVLGHAQLADAVNAAGLRFRPFTAARRWSPIVERPGVKSMLGWLRLASDRGIARDTAAELARRPVDAVIVDCMIPVALGPARRSGGRVVLLLHTMSEYWVRQWAVTSPMGAWLRLTGPHPHRTPSDLALVTTAPEFDVIDEPAIPADEIAQTGPVLAAPAVREDDTGTARSELPLLVSFSTISYPGQHAAMQRTLDAIAPLPVTAIATIGPSLDPRALRIPPNVQQRGYTPHGELLPDVRLLVGHGGHGTTMAALAHGVPALVIAMSSHTDQPIVGDALARTGAGAVLPREATVEQLRQAITTLLADDAATHRATQVAAAWRDGRAAERAAEAVSGLLSGAPRSPGERRPT